MPEFVLKVLINNLFVYEKDNDGEVSIIGIQLYKKCNHNHNHDLDIENMPFVTISNNVLIRLLFSDRVNIEDYGITYPILLK
jgi:hypothetical protein